MGSWMERQIYLSLGTLLLGAAALEIDACPMDGFDPAAVNAALDLAERGYTALAIVALGYRSEADFNVNLPKSRLPAETVISHL